MNINKLLQASTIGLILAVGGTAHAAGTKQTHHCKMADGTTDTTKTHKQCTAAKGTWAKDAAASTAPAAAKPAAAPAAAAPAAPAAAPAAAAPAATPAPATAPKN